MTTLTQSLVKGFQASVIEYVNTLNPVDIRLPWQVDEGWYRVRIETTKGSDLTVTLMPLSIEEGSMEVYCRFESSCLVNWLHGDYNQHSGKYNFHAWDESDPDAGLGRFKDHLFAVLN